MTPADGVLRPGGLALTERLVDYCAFVPGARVVDIGCGTGVTVAYLRDSRRLDAMGVDLSEARLQAGRDWSPGLPLLQAAGEALPFADRSVDGVIAECSLSVMGPAGKVLAECHRVLRPGGKLALTDVYLRDAGGPAVAGELPERTARLMTRDELSVVVAGAGFCIMVWEDFSVLLREFIARFIMEHGSADELQRCLPAKPGYYLLVAEKCREKDPEGVNGKPHVAGLPTNTGERDDEFGQCLSALRCCYKKLAAL